MTLNSRLVVVVLCSSFFLGSAAFAQEAALEADVSGVDGCPSKGAEVRIERQDKKMAPIIAKTDRHGHLAATNIEPGTYKITAKVEGGIQSWQIVKTQTSKPLRVTFEMSKSAAITSKQKKKMVWVPPQTGSRLGGHWEEQNGPGAAQDNGQNVSTMGSQDWDKTTRQMNFAPAKAGGGQ
jgi:hypothetical protein